MLFWVHALLADHPQPFSGDLVEGPHSEGAPKVIFRGTMYDHIPF